MTPTFIYGTAWNEEATAELVRVAVNAGFRAIDTANQPKHYAEAAVGDALQTVLRDVCRREALWIQTKFTPLHGHDERVPYNPRADVPAQVKQSFESSLEHLQMDYVDSYLLHGPHSSSGLVEQDWEVWGAMEDICRSGRARSIGISNVNARQIDALAERAQVRPTMVQNRCYANRGWDSEVRAMCRRHGITYQGFSLVRGNASALRDSRMMSMADRLGVNTSCLVFRFAMQLGMIPVTGTTDSQHMSDNLRVAGLDDLTAEEMSTIELIATQSKEV